MIRFVMPPEALHKAASTEIARPSPHEWSPLSATERAQIHTAATCLD